MHLSVRRTGHRYALLPFSLFCTLLLAGCNLAQFSAVSTASAVMPGFSGNVQGGQQPVTGASVQLYAANITTNKGASTPLLLSTVTTDANGNFNITAQYTCPTPASLVYLVATNGNPGLTTGTNNSALALMTALGTCGDLLLGGNNITVIINELTTVAAVEALGGFMADYAHVGANTVANPNVLSTAFANANAIVNSSTGQFAAQAAGAPTVPKSLYITLANILASCINSGGNTGSTSNCYKLFNATNSSYTDVIAALLYIVQHPATNVTTLFFLIGPTPPFQPQSSTPPNDLTTALVITIPNTGESGCCSKQQLAIDTSQQVWVGNLYTKGVHVYSNAGALLYTFTLPQPLLKISSDGLGNVWMLVGTLSSGVSAGATLVKYSSAGVLLSPAAGYTTVQGAGPQLYTYEVAGTDDADLRFDSLGNAWVTGYSTALSKACLLKYATTGTFLLAACSTQSPVYHGAIAVDSSDNVYLANVNLYKFSQLGVSQFTTPPSLPSTPNSYFMRYDASQDHIWVYDGNDLTAFTSSGAVAKARFADALNVAHDFGLDGAGNLYSSGNYPAGVSEFDSTGTLVTPFLGYISNFVLGVQPLDFEVDSLGNIWGVGGNNGLVRLSGIAVPRPQTYR